MMSQLCALLIVAGGFGPQALGQPDMASQIPGSLLASVQAESKDTESTELQNVEATAPQVEGPQALPAVDEEAPVSVDPISEVAEPAEKKKPAAVQQKDKKKPRKPKPGY